MWAVKRNYAEMTLELLANFSRINWKDIGGRTALHFAVKNENFTIVKMLLNYRANPGVKSDSMMSPTDLAKELGLKKIHSFLHKAEMILLAISFEIK